MLHPAPYYAANEFIVMHFPINRIIPYHTIPYHIMVCMVCGMVCALSINNQFYYLFEQLLLSVRSSKVAI
jgi:hypothetical protein